MRILILKGGIQYNLTEEEVQQQLATKRLSLSDRASCEGGRDWWIPLKEVLEFIAAKRSERPNESNKRKQPPTSPQQQSQCLDHYDVLGVSRSASQDDIKAAYRLRMQEYHPDKVAHLGSEIRILAERKAKEINDAYQALRQ